MNIEKAVKKETRKLKRLLFGGDNPNLSPLEKRKALRRKRKKLADKSKRKNRK